MAKVAQVAQVAKVAAMTEANETARPRTGKMLTGVVTSTGGDKTIRVNVNALVKHVRYGKYVRRRTRLAVHDPNNEAALGDQVEIVSCRPISKTKSWRLVRVVRRADVETSSAVDG